MRAHERPEPGREAILAALERHGVEYVVIGGAAAQSRGWPEETQDLDVAPERSRENLSRLADAVEELGGGFRVDERRYPHGYRPPGGIDARTFHNQICVAFATRHGNFDVVLIPDGTRGYEEIARTATRERMAGTQIVVPVAAAETILHSKTIANRQKDRDTLQRMREVLDPPRDSHTEGHSAPAKDLEQLEPTRTDDDPARSRDVDARERPDDYSCDRFDPDRFDPEHFGPDPWGYRDPFLESSRDTDRSRVRDSYEPPER
jgi:hypothetical protein